MIVVGPVPETGSLFETEEKVALLDIADEGRIMLDASAELGGGVASV